MGINWGWGSATAGQQVSVQFESHSVTWVIRTLDGTEVARHPARELSRERIRGLTVARRPPSGRRRRQAGPPLRVLAQARTHSAGQSKAA
jgi:hypothetical protein